MVSEEGRWHYKINYGPEGEENYANVFNASGEFVGNLKIHHAREIVTAARVRAEDNAEGGEVVAWAEPRITNPDIPNPTGVPYLDCLLHRLLDAQQDINLEANERMSQSLCDVSALFEEVETAIRRLARPAPQPSGTVEVKPLADLIHDALAFAVWAAGEGLCPTDGPPAPEDFLYAYSAATGFENWDAIPHHVATTLSALTAGKPEQSGWKLVPEEPTDEMADAALAVSNDTRLNTLTNTAAMREIIKAAIAASPHPTHGRRR